MITSNNSPIQGSV